MLLALILSMLLQFSPFGMLIAVTFEHADSCHLWACCKFSASEHAASTHTEHAASSHPLTCRNISLFRHAASSHPDTTLPSHTITIQHHDPPLTISHSPKLCTGSTYQHLLSVVITERERGGYWRQRETCSEAVQEAKGGEGGLNPRYTIRWISCVFIMRDSAACNGLRSGRRGEGGSLCA